MSDYELEYEVKRIFDASAVSLSAYNDLYSQIVRLVKRAVEEARDGN